MSLFAEKNFREKTQTVFEFVVGYIFWAVVVIIIVSLFFIGNDSSQSTTGCPASQPDACAEYYDDLRGEVGIP